MGGSGDHRPQALRAPDRASGSDRPNPDHPALTDVSLHLPAGRVVALIGENGAGKSTLVKLLCRLYEPTAGTVAVDGVDLRRFDVVDWRERISAGFQDYCHYEVLVREAVGVGDVARVDDDDAIHTGLARAGAAGLVDALPAGLDTQLGTTWDGGVDLSGGQWQKLALRAGAHGGSAAAARARRADGRA